MIEINVSNEDLRAVVRQMAAQMAEKDVLIAALQRTLVEREVKEATDAGEGTSDRQGKVSGVNAERRKGKGHDEG